MHDDKGQVICQVICLAHTCVLNALLEALGHLSQVDHDLGVALLTQPQELHPAPKFMKCSDFQQ